MSQADALYRATCLDILEHGVWDTEQAVRPRWEDGTPAHTIKKFGVVNRYDLREEFPIMTLRRTAFRNCVDELLWIWQKKSNNVNDLHSHGTCLLTNRENTYTVLGEVVKTITRDSDGMTIPVSYVDPDRIAISPNGDGFYDIAVPLAGTSAKCQGDSTGRSGQPGQRDCQTGKRI